MNEPVFENSMCTEKQKLWNKYSPMGLHSKRYNWLQTGALTYSTGLRHTKNKFILVKFPTRCDGCFFLYKVRKSYFLFENDKSFIYFDYEVALVTAIISKQDSMQSSYTYKLHLTQFDYHYMSTCSSY